MQQVTTSGKRPAPSHPAQTSLYPRNEYAIPVYPHVRKFIQKKFKCKDTLHTSEHTTLGMLVTVALKDNPRKGLGQIHNMNVRPETAEKLTHSLSLVITKRQADHAVRLSKLARLNNFFDRMFKEHMVTFIEAQVAQGFPAYTACANFLAHYGIEDHEYSLATAYRTYQNLK